jgi:hypothetical protein
MSDMPEGGGFDGVEIEPTPSDADDSASSGLDEVLSDLFVAIEELGLASGGAEEASASAAGCYLSTVPSDRHGHRGVVVGWLLPAAIARGTAPPERTESVDILNEALGPLLLALGFPIEPYAPDGQWLVTGPRTVT